MEIRWGPRAPPDLARRLKRGARAHVSASGVTRISRPTQQICGAVPADRPLR
jgi:hypothetical protein